MKINKSSSTALHGLGGSLATTYMEAFRPTFLPSHKAENQVIQLGMVLASITANVPVDNTLHNKQTGEGGRAKTDQAKPLEPKWLLVQLFNNSNK